MTGGPATNPVFTKMVIIILFLAGAFALAYKYDSEIIWLFFAVGGGICGISVPPIFKLLSEWNLAKDRAQAEKKPQKVKVRLPLWKRKGDE